MVTMAVGHAHPLRCLYDGGGPGQYTRSGGSRFCIHGTRAIEGANLRRSQKAQEGCGDLQLQNPGACRIAGYTRVPHRDHLATLKRCENTFAFAGLITAMAAYAIKNRRTIRTASLIRYAGTGGGREPAHAQCGDVLTGWVTEILDAGLVLQTEDGRKAFIAALELQRAKEDYTLDDKLEITVRRLPVAWSGKNSLWATDRSLRPLSSVERGSVVDGRVLNISDAGVLLDIDVPRHGFACWEHLKPLGKDRADVSAGDTIHDLKVRAINPSNVQLGAASLELRDMSDFKVGEVVSGVVVNIAKKINAVFFDIGAPTDAAAFGRKRQLAKNARRYVHGEAVELEVVKVEGEKIDVRDMTV